MKDSPDETGNIPGRLAYLKAFDHLWPEALQELRDEVAPKFAHLWNDMPDSPSNRIPLERMGRLASIEDEMRSLSSMMILRRWARGFEIRDQWIFDAAVDTILWHYDTGNVNGPWFWFPLESRNPPFNPTISGTWYPSESWGEFQERIGAQINGQLAHYRRDCKRRSSTSKPELTRDAQWTVRYQRGNRAKDIAAGLFRGYQQPEQAVYRAIKRFAKDIGLTLRSRHSKQQ